MAKSKPAPKPAVETPAAQENSNVTTLTLVKLYDNGKATYSVDGGKGRIRLSPLMFAVKGTVPQTIQIVGDGFATVSAEEAAKAAERAAKRAARKAKSAETAATRLAKAEEKAKKANERLAKLKAAGQPKAEPATEAPAGTEAPFEPPATE
jgi:hypothetical protein